jgi:glyoxylase-like metal-dependent hydrolase (beta-lactamase superfamily II)
MSENIYHPQAVWLSRRRLRQAQRMKIIPLSEGSFTVDQTKQFVPFDGAQDDLQQRPSGSLLVEIQPFAIITPRDVLILDSGLGFSPDGMLQIHQNLKHWGITPDQVTKVLMSHLHKDHSGGMSEVDPATGMRRPSFPQASYYVQAEELAYGLQRGFPSYQTDEFAWLSGYERFVPLRGSGVVDGYIKYELTGAHCPYHQVFWIVDEGETIFFGGDVAPQLQQMKNRFVAKYDYDGKKSMELRKTWWQEGEKNNWTFLFYHDINSSVYPRPSG